MFYSLNFFRRCLSTLLLSAISSSVGFAGTSSDPLELSLLVTGPREIQLQWKDTTADETGFKIERRESGGKNWEALPVAKANATTQKDGNLTPGATYIYRISPIVSGKLPVSEARITTGVPAIPVNFLASAVSPTEVFLTWRDEADSEDSVVIERRDGEIDFRAVGKSARNGISFLDKGLTTGTQVIYRVKAVNAAGQLGYSNEFRATPQAAGNTGAMHGLRGEYFNDSELKWGPRYIWTEPTIDFNWGENGPSAPLPKDGFSVRWTGEIEAPAEGAFTIYLTADDGARLWVGGKLLIDHWDGSGKSERTAQVAFKKGEKLPIRLEYCDRSGEAMIRLEWSGPATLRQIIPHTRLSSHSTLYANGRGLLETGSIKQFPKVQQVGTPVQFELWDWVDKDKRKQIGVLKNGAKIPLESLPQSIQFQAKAPVDHDQVSFYAASSDSFDVTQWGPTKTKGEKSPAEELYKLSGLGSPRQIGKYCLGFKAEKSGKIVAHSVIHFEIVNSTPPPSGTTFTKNLKDSFGNQVTYSKPVLLTKLNETPKLLDNDYPFEPQQAFNTINWERFPPFKMAPRFFATYNSRRFVEENKIGGPLNRGFTSQAVVKNEYDNLIIQERSWWHTPDQQVQLINEWMKTEPQKFKDLKGYADLRSAFVSKENAYYLGWKSYESWGAGGYAPYDAGLYGWDEEQMWGGAVDEICRKQPDLLPEELRPLKDKVLAGDKEAWAKIYNVYYAKQGDFVGQTYRGAKENAAQRGRRIKVWHYGSGTASNMLFLAAHDGGKTNGKYLYEDQETLTSWFKDRRGNLDFDATDYVRNIDYFHHDFYYHTIFPEKLTMYEKDKAGKYVLDEKGRRRIRKDVVEEKVYGAADKIGHEDFEVSPMFLHAFISKGEANLYWFNGGKYYKKSGTPITDKSIVPALRPRNQETWGDTAKFGQRTINPYLAEAAPIFTFMIGCEGMYYWDQNLFISPMGSEIKPDEASKQSCGDIESCVKGMHRISQLNPLFEGNYQFIRPFRHFHTYERDHPIIRGIVNGCYLALAMTHTYLDPGETQEVELWYDASYEKRGTAVWKDTVTLNARKTHIFQCKLPALPEGVEYDPNKLYFRYITKDGKYSATHFVTGNYHVEYPFAATTPSPK